MEKRQFTRKMENKFVYYGRKSSWIFFVEKYEDCNALKKISFNGRLMPSLEASSTIPQEIIGGRKSQAATPSIKQKINFRCFQCHETTHSYDMC